MSERCPWPSIETGRRIGVAAAGVTTFLNMYATQAILPELARGFSADLAATGLTVTAPLLAVAIVAPFVGSVSDRLGRKRLIVTAGVLLVLPTLAAAAAPSLAFLVFCRFVQGLLLPFVFTVTVAYIGDEVSGRAAIRLSGTYVSGTIFGGFLGRLTAGLMTAWAGWRVAFVLLAGASAAAVAVIAFLLPREGKFRPTGTLRQAAADFALHLSNPRLLVTDAVGFAVLFCIVATFTFVGFRLAAPPFGLGPAELGLIFVVYLLGAVVTPLAMRMATRLGRRPTLAIAVGSALTGLALTLPASLPLVIAGLALASSGFFISQALAIGFIGSAARRARAAAVGLYVTCYYIGGATGGIAPARIWAVAGWPGCAALVGLVQIAVLGAALTAWREER